MPFILPEFVSLGDYVCSFNNPHKQHPASCIYCGYHKIHKHGTRSRQADRDNRSANSLNPVLIQRYRCASCKRTFSALPICIPPRRWYNWNKQQAVLNAYLEGKSYRNMEQHLDVARSTVSRWIRRFKEKFITHVDHFRQFATDLLAQATDFRSVWKQCLSKWSLSKIMYQLHLANVIIP